MLTGFRKDYRSIMVSFLYFAENVCIVSPTTKKFVTAFTLNCNRFMDLDDLDIQTKSRCQFILLIESKFSFSFLFSLSFHPLRNSLACLCGNIGRKWDPRRWLFTVLSVIIESITGSLFFYFYLLWPRNHRNESNNAKHSDYVNWLATPREKI